MATRRKGDRVLGPYPRRNAWRVILIREDGVRTYQDCATEAKARALIAGVEDQLEQTAGTTLADAIDMYRAHLVEKGNKPGPIADTTWRLGRVFASCLTAPVASLRTKVDGQRLYDELRAYVSPKTKRPYSADSHRNFLIEARTFLRWCVDRKLTKVNVLGDVAGVGKRVKGADKTQLRIDEARRWYAVALAEAKRGKEGAVAALMAALLNARCSEIVQRHVRDLDDDGWVLWIVDTKTAAGSRTLEVPNVLRPLLKKLARGKAPTDFLLGEGKIARDRNYPSKWCKKLCRAAKVPEVGGHGMRRMHATVAIMAGQTPHVVAKELGHENFSTTAESYVRRGTVDAVSSRKANEMITGERRPARPATERRAPVVLAKLPAT